MASKPMFPKRDPKRKKKSGFHSFIEEEFDAYLAKLVEEDMNCCSLSEETDLIFYLSVHLNIAYYKSYCDYNTFR